LEKWEFDYLMITKSTNNTPESNGTMLQGIFLAGVVAAEWKLINVLLRIPRFSRPIEF